MQRKKAWTRLSDAGYLIGILGAALAAAMWAANSAAPRGSLIFNLETLGFILLLIGFGLAVVAGIALGNMWPYGPIK